MANALKCDRCGSYFDYNPEAKFNFIAFGHKDIIIGKNFPVKDICPDCMELFMKWFENPDNYEPQDLVKNITEEYDRVIKSGDRRAIAHFKNKHGYTMTKEEIDIVNEDKVKHDSIICSPGTPTMDEVRDFCINFSKECSECPFYDEDSWDECSLNKEPHNWSSEEEIISKLLDYKIKHPDWRKKDK